MATKKVQAEKSSELSEKSSELSTEETYRLHNHETAQASDARLQCQCKDCKSYRGE